MTLIMTIGNVVAERVELCYDGLLTCSERQEYQQAIAAELYCKHASLLFWHRVEPSFFIEGVTSKMNEHSPITL